MSGKKSLPSRLLGLVGVEEILYILKQIDKAMD